MTFVKKSAGAFSIVLLIAIFMAISGAQLAYCYQTQHVVVVLVDGLRYTEGLGSVNCPKLNALASQAAVHDSAFNDSITVTASAVPASWMGRFYPLVDTTYQGNAIQFCRYPTYWEYARKDLGYSASQVIYVTPNYGSSTWQPSFYPGYGPSYWPQFIQPPSVVGNNDFRDFDSTVVVLKRQHPKLLYIYLPDVDHAGHSGVMADYLAKIHIADSLCKAIWDTIQSDTALANKTAMIITNDHGRHTTNFSGHGDGCFGCRHVMMFCIGPDFKRNFHSSGPRARMTDVTKTVGALLGYSAPYSTGRVLTELFTTACVAPVAVAPHDTTMLRCNLSQIVLHGFSATDSDNNLDTVYAVGGIFRGDSVTFTPVAGLNTIRLIAIDTCGLADTAITLVTINLNHAPVAVSPLNSIIVDSGQTQICLQGFSAADIDGNLYQVFAIGGILRNDTVCFTPISGNNTIRLVAIDACGLADTATTIVLFQGTGPACNYHTGDINGDGNVAGSDVTFGVRYFKGVGSQPPDSCYHDSLPDNHWLYVAGDINGDCQFKGSDITRLVSYFKGLGTLGFCAWTPPPLLKTKDTLTKHLPK